MKVIEKCGSRRDANRYQLEDWSKDWDFEKYPGLRSMSFCVGCYVLANDKYPLYPQWRILRVDIDFNTLEEANECYRSLIEGKKQIVDYKEHVYKREKLEWIR